MSADPLLTLAMVVVLVAADGGCVAHSYIRQGPVHLHLSALALLVLLLRLVMMMALLHSSTASF